VGSTDRLDSIQAAILEVKIRYIDQWNKARRENAEKYKYYFRNVDEVFLPFVPEWAMPIWHLFVVQVKQREKLTDYLKQNGIGTGYHYKTPLHLLQALKHLGYQKGDFPVTEKVMSKIISLPMYPELTEEQIKYVVEKVQEFYTR
jgi:dTDP-4-amino-4,6-dideoxygalactose transaminase